MNELIQGRFWVSAVHLTGAQALGHGQRHPTRLKPHSPIKGMVGRCTAASELSMHKPNPQGILKPLHLIS